MTIRSALRRGGRLDRAAYDKALQNPSRSGAAPPTWMQEYDLCMLRQLGDRSGAGPRAAPRASPSPN